MNRTTKRVLVLIVGWGFILVGIAGLVLPILQGVLFIVIGLVILSTEYVWAHHLLARLKERFPKLGRTVDEATHRASRWLQRLTRQRETD
ncbi:MAG TPA: PGPGW domain-containing protein [Terriglobales bacterium]|nr:PGPGW domain-containing protein [Terriglobales bacterium]